MVKIILMLALLQYISNFLFGYKSNIMSCGIFGQATNIPENLDVNGVHILGIYNIERGKMSCGLSWDGDVQYGLGADKLYTDFIIDREIKPTKIPIMIGHTRQPSHGMSINEDNAHPFGFGTSKDSKSYEMIFCHNGTLKNHKELAKKYDIELTEKVVRISHANHSYETTRDKIDSEILGEILYKTKNFKVLSEYIGAAALAWTWIDEPNKLYLWSGASKYTKGSTITTETEERPMNVFCKNQNSMFFSSLEDSLTVLGASRKDNLQINYNTVYIITDGDFENAEKHKISRKQAGQTESFVYNATSRYFDAGCCDFEFDEFDDVRELNKEVRIIPDVEIKPSLMTNLHNDSPIHPIIDYRNRIYCKSLRYWENGSIITDGVYIYIKDFGFKFAGINLVTANAYIKNIKGLSFNYRSGIFNYNTLDTIGYVPFKKEVENIQYHYFINGVLLKTLEDYNRATILKNELKSPSKYINHQTLSYMSKHPVIDMDPKQDITVAMFQGSPFTGNITELGFEKIYYFSNGILTKWVKREDLTFKKESDIIILPASTQTLKFDKDLFNQAIESIKDFEKNIKIEEVVKEIDDEKFIEEMITDSFERHSEEVSETIIELSDWKDNETVKAALNTLYLINHTLKDFIEKPNIK